LIDSMLSGGWDEIYRGDVDSGGTVIGSWARIERGDTAVAPWTTDTYLALAEGFREPVNTFLDAVLPNPIVPVASGDVRQ